MSEISYTTPSLCDYEGDLSKSWFVYFDVTDLDTLITVRKQFRGGINYYTDYQKRTNAGRELVKHWIKMLKDGWSPFVNTGINNLSKMKFDEALDFALSKCTVASKSKQGYIGTVKFFKNAAKKLKLDGAVISGIKRQHIKLLLDQIKKDRNWSNHAYNKNLNYLSGILSRLVEYEVIDHNPAFKIKKLPIVETMMYEPITAHEKDQIATYLTSTHLSFFTYLMVIYHTGIRPKEVLALKISDISIERRLIIIKPDLIAENSKTKTIRMVPINDHLAALLLQHLHGDYPGNYYVFGSPCETGKGNTGRGSESGGKSGSSRSDYFNPAPVIIKRDTATKLWEKLIIIGLGIKKHMYALKHTGADDKILAGISLDALKELYGHSSVLMTEKYARKVKHVYRDQIMAMSPKF